MKTELTTKRYFSVSIIPVFVIMLSLLNSCKKTEFINPTFTTPKKDYEKIFFKTSAAVDPTVQRIALHIADQNNEFHFVNDFAAKEGLPRWDKAELQIHRQIASLSGKDNSIQSVENGDTVVLIPLVLDSTSYVNSFLACAVGDSINIRVIRGRDYEQYGFDQNSDSITATRVALQTMLLEKHVFGHDNFSLGDLRLFKHTESGITIYPDHCHLNNPDSNIVPSLMVPITTCTEVTVDGGFLVGCPPGAEHCLDLETYEICDTWTVYIDEGGSGYGGGSPCTNCISYWWVPSGGGGAIGWYYQSSTSIWSGINNPTDVADQTVDLSGTGLTFGPLLPDDQIPPIRRIAHSPSRGNVEDMTHGNDCDMTGILPLGNLTDDELFAKMGLLVSATTVFNSQLQNVGYAMIDKFRYGNGGTFSDAGLNGNVFDAKKFKDYMKAVGVQLNIKLQLHNWDITNVGDINMGTTRPIFNGMHHMFHGLQILINDTEYTDVDLKSFTINPTTHYWTARVLVTIHDHFGLDKNDALTYQNMDPLIAPGFAAWWILQHCRNYKPFETVVTIPMDLVCDPTLNNY